MLISMLSHLLSAWFAFLLPSFSTFKALSHRPLSEPELERWAMYWTVIGAFLAFEYVAEPLISWFPFYWEIKTLFLLFLSLPQTQGSTYIYNMYLSPFFVRNEQDLDAGIISAQRSTFAFVQARLSTLLNALANKSAGPTSSTPGQPAPASGSLSLESAMGLLKSFAPSAMGILQSSSQSQPAAASSSSVQPSAAPPAEQRHSQTPDATPFPEPQQN